MIQIGSYQVLLERLEEEEKWKVLISTYTFPEIRFDEWIDCENLHAARSFILDFSDTSARSFLTRATAGIVRKEVNAH